MATKLLKRTFIIVLTLSLLFLSIAPALAAEGIGTATTVGSVNLRSGMGTEYSSLAKLKKGVSVTVLDASHEGWVKVLASGTEGYIAREYLDMSGISEPKEAGEPGVITNTTHLYDGTAGNAKRLTTIRKNTAVTVLDTAGSRWQVSYNGETGYVPSKDVKLGMPDEKATTKTTTGAKKATTADVNAAKIAKATAKNSDTVGWINVPGTNIDEPILYRANFYYAYRNIDKKKSYEGVYPHTNKDTKNIVIYGHNLRGSATIFHHLHHLEESARGYTKCQHSKCSRSFSSGTKDWHKTSAGRTWNISIFGYQKWEVFAMYEVKKNEPISTLRTNWTTNPSNMDSWIGKQVERSKSYMGFDFGVSVSGKDKIMTLITCGTNYDSATANSRLFVFLKNVD